MLGIVLEVMYKLRSLNSLIDEHHVFLRQACPLVYLSEKSMLV